MSTLPEVGFEAPVRNEPVPALRPVALVQLIATITLVLSTLIAATAVSIGLAHAARPSAGADRVPFAAAQTYQGR